MSAGQNAQNIHPKVTLFCHPQNDFCYVSCIICDSAFVKVIFFRKINKGKDFFITNTLIVYPEHNITYNTRHVQDIEDEKLNYLELLRLKVELINQEIFNLTAMDQKSSDANDENESEIKVNTVLSIGMLLRENNMANKMISERNTGNNELSENNTFLRANLLLKKTYVLYIYECKKML